MKTRFTFPFTFFLFITLTFLFSCNSVQSKIDRISEIDIQVKALKAKLNENNLAQITLQVMELMDERRQLIEELKEIDKTKLTPQQISVVYADNSAFENHFKEGRKQFYAKNYSASVESLKNAKSLSIKNDSLEPYFLAAQCFYYLENSKNSNENLRFSDIDEISNILNGLNANSLIPAENKSTIRKDLRKLIENLYSSSFPDPGEVYVKDGIYQYKSYYDRTSKVLSTLKKGDSLYNIFSNPKVKTIFSKYDKSNLKAYTDFLKFGQPSIMDLEIASTVYLKKTMNDPNSLDIIEKENYAKKNQSGYTYRMQVRGKNAFNATVTQIVTFYCKYDVASASYYCYNSKIN